MGLFGASGKRVKGLVWGEWIDKTSVFCYNKTVAEKRA